QPAPDEFRNTFFDLSIHRWNKGFPENSQLCFGRKKSRFQEGGWGSGYRNGFTISYHVPVFGFIACEKLLVSQAEFGYQMIDEVSFGLDRIGSVFDEIAAASLRAYATACPVRRFKQGHFHSQLHQTIPRHEAGDTATNDCDTFHKTAFPGKTARGFWLLHRNITPG